MSDKIAIFGSTGSIGRQSLEVIKAFPKDLQVVAMAAKDEIDLICEQIKTFSPKIFCVANDNIKEKIRKNIGKTSTKIIFGEDGLKKIATFSEAATLLVAIPGSLSLEATLLAIQAKKDIALATKEVLVTAGNLMMNEIRKNKVNIFPIDSEHSAIAQCLNGEDHKKIKKIIITASGGAFLRTPKKDLLKMTARDALKHPTWNMGPKITIDSATLMNKGFEVLEAHHLFGIDLAQIKVVIHPQSIIHSMVEFVDGSIMAQMGAPDMRVPIQYALLKKTRMLNSFKKLDITKGLELNFESPDKDKFPCLEFAYEAGRRGGTMGATLNAANETAVNLFLEDKIKFSEIAVIIRKAMDKDLGIKKPRIKEILQADKLARELS